MKPGDGEIMKGSIVFSKSPESKSLKKPVKAIGDLI
jgi:hypothetical protein